ncbi:MAG: energy transducer TonB [Saprospiraceae bacterium]|nr:energy transducer TonB [Saprospiraceae bacterium]
MKNFPQSWMSVLLAFAFPVLMMAQNNGLHYEVNRVYPYLSVSSEQLKAANSIAEFNQHFKPNWIRAYESVTVLTTIQGNLQQSVSNSDVLTPAQKDNLNSVDAGTEISVVVRYLPENTLQHNDIQEFDFTFSINPDYDASFAGGPEALMHYLQETAIQAIPANQFKGLDMAAIKFTVNHTGDIVEASMFQSTKSAEMDQILLEAIHQMPTWKPATYADGTTVQQEFALTLGNMENCMVNLLNIRRD